MDNDTSPVSVALEEYTATCDLFDDVRRGFTAKQINHVLDTFQSIHTLADDAEFHDAFYACKDLQVLIGLYKNAGCNNG